MFISSGYYNICIGDCVKRKRKRSSWVKKKKKREKGETLTFFLIRLLIIFRLWRVVKVIEAVVLSMSFTHQEELEKLKERNEELQEKLKQVEQRNRELEQQVGQN